MRKALGLIAAFAASAAFADFTAWTHKATITLNTSAGGANVAGDVTNYPTLIRLLPAHTEFWAVAKANGDDVRFTLMDNLTELPHEIEYWSDAGDTAVIWVLVPSITGNSSANQIRLHTGNVAAVSTSDGAAVFAPANNWLAVWHMNQAITAATDSALDATGNNNKAAPGLAGLTYPFPQVNTAIGPGYDLGGTSNTVGRFFEVPDADSSLNLNTTNGSFSISAWVNAVTGSRSGIITKYHNGVNNGRQFALQTAGSGSNWTLVVNPTSQYNQAGANEFLANGAKTAGWEYVSGTYSGPFPTLDAAGAEATMNLYLNGSAVSTWSSFTQGSTQIGTAAPFRIGAIVDGGGATTQRLLRGSIDEARVSNVARSADWAKLDYESQRPDGQTLVSIGAAVPVNDVRAMATGSITAKSTSAGVTFRLPANAVGTLSVVDVHGRTVFSRDVTAGTQEISWKSVSGKGIYFARFASKNANIRLADAKFTVIK